MPKQEILPPLKSGELSPLEHNLPAPKPAAIPTVYHGDSWDAFWDRRRWDNQTRAVESLTRLNHAETACTNAQTGLVESNNRLKAALAAAAELPERLHHELQVRRVQRADELRTVAHGHDLNRHRQQREVVVAETEKTKALAALVDARQQLQAQQDFGYAGYRLAWKQRAYQTFGVELTPEERRALVEEHVPSVAAKKPGQSPRAGEMDDALYEARQELLARGIDPTVIDEIIARRRTP